MKKIKPEMNPNGSKTIYPSTTPQIPAAPLKAGSGGVYEVDKTSGGTVTRTVTYYPAGGAMSKIPRPAGRINITGGSNTLYYVLKDHPSASLRASLGSASVVTDANGNIVGEQRYCEATPHSGRSQRHLILWFTGLQRRRRVGPDLLYWIILRDGDICASMATQLQ